ncbi:MAG: 2-oxo acid dehydrogenase subunit E2 [Myxococcales bacterium]|nr:2-oxo acid dehydrogenase subunit E2 [Myxococcales bacterium]
MSFVFELPEVGEGVVEAEVVSWNVREGDYVQVDQPLCEITTDKAQLEISSPKAGRVIKLHGAPGDIIKVHEPLVELDTDADGADASASAPAEDPPTQPLTNGASGAATPPPRPAPTPVASPPTDGPTKATPAVRREAREMGIDIHTVAGTGRGGRVTRDDLASHGTTPAPAPTAASPTPFLPPALPQVHTPTSGTEERVKILGVRRAIADQMTKSKRTAAHFTYVEEVDCTELVALRTRIKTAAAPRGIRVTYIPIIMKAVSLVLHQFPNINAVMDEETFELVVKGDHNIGISTDTPNGLYVPVIRNVEQKSILHIAAEMTDLTERTRQGKAKLDELRGGTFTMTSVGAIGGVLATPILNVPQVAILGVNAIREQAVVRDGEIVVRPMMYLSPSFDHRVIDGAVGARFVAALKEVLENPETLLMELR